MFVKSPVRIINGLLLVIFLALSGCTLSNSPTPPTVAPTNKIEWQYGVFGGDIGDAGLFVQDLNGDGQTEIITTAAEFTISLNEPKFYFCYILQKSALNDYEQKWRSPSFTSRISRLVLADINKNGAFDLVIALEDGSIYIYDGSNYQQIAHYNTGHFTTDIALADIYQNGNLELVSSDGIGLYVYSPGSGDLLWSRPTGGGGVLAVGNVDGDHGLEIISSSPRVIRSYGPNLHPQTPSGYVTDAIHRTVEWTNSGFGSVIKLADLNNDGIQEIIGAESWKTMAAFDAVHHSSLWEIPITEEINTMLIQDVTGDNNPEILYGSGTSGSVHAYSPLSKSLLWTIGDEAHWFGGIAWGDTDGDGNSELVWSMQNSLLIADPISKQIKWQNISQGGPFSAQDVGDIDGDNNDEIVMVSLKSYSGFYNGNTISAGYLQSFDAKTHALKWQEPLGTDDAHGTQALSLADTDNDGIKDIVVTTANSYDGFIRVYDGVTHQIKAQSAVYNSGAFTSVAVGDIDGDSKNEIVAGLASATSGLSEINIIILDGVTLQEKWRTENLPENFDGFYSIRLVDLNGQHVILATLNGLNKVIAYDGITHSQLWQTDSPAYALDIANIDSDTAKEILVGRVDGKIDVYSSVDFSFKQTITTPSTKPIYALHVEDINQDGQLDWLMTSGDTLYALDPTHPEKALWQQGSLSENLGRHNQMVVKDINHDGSMKLVVGSDVALYQFGL